MSTKYSGTRDKIALGHDFNFFTKIVPSVVSLASPFGTGCDVLITIPTQTVTFQLEGSGNIQYSFNGNTLHGDMQNGLSSASLIFQHRTISKIWFRGTGTVRIEAWSP